MMRPSKTSCGRAARASRLRAMFPLLGSVSALLTGTGYARTWHVPLEVPTVKVAVEDSASYGDSVLVAPGVYDTSSGEVFPIIMKDGVTLMSEGGASVTTLDANETAGVMTCSDLDSTSVITGLTITGGFAPSGGGLYCVECYMVIEDNVIEANTATGRVGAGGGVYCRGGAPTVLNNRIRDNTVPSWMGGGVYCLQSNGVIVGNTVSGNTAMYGGGIFNDRSSPYIAENRVEGNTALATGGGVDCFQSSSPLIEKNVVINNFAWENGPGIACCFSSSPTICFNTIAGNIGDYGGGVRPRTSSSAVITANAIVDNVDGIYLESDSDVIIATGNNIYFNTYQAGDLEIINATASTLDLIGNFWWVTDSASVRALILGEADFMPCLTAPSDSAPGEPSAVTSVTVFRDQAFTNELMGSATIGDTLFIEVVGDDWNESLVDPALVIVTSSLDPYGIAVALLETGPATGIYRGTAFITTTSIDVFNEIGANDTDTLTVMANVDPSELTTVMVGVTEAHGGGGGRAALAGAGLLEASPNPFNNRTEIRFGLPETWHVSVRVYDMRGRAVATLVEDELGAGYHSAVWETRDTPEGVYVCRLEAGGSSYTKQLVLAR